MPPDPADGYRHKGNDMSSLQMLNPSAGLQGRRMRPAPSGVHGGASSMLRLARKAETRLPSGAALSDWADRAAAMLDLTPMVVGPQGHGVRS